MRQTAAGRARGGDRLPGAASGPEPSSPRARSPDGAQRSSPGGEGGSLCPQRPAGRCRCGRRDPSGGVSGRARAGQRAGPSAETARGGQRFRHLGLSRVRLVTPGTGSPTLRTRRQLLLPRESGAPCRPRRPGPASAPLGWARAATRGRWQGGRSGPRGALPCSSRGARRGRGQQPRSRRLESARAAVSLGPARVTGAQGPRAAGANGPRSSAGSAAESRCRGRGSRGERATVAASAAEQLRGGGIRTPRNSPISRVQFHGAWCIYRAVHHHHSRF